MNECAISLFLVHFTRQFVSMIYLRNVNLNVNFRRAIQRKLVTSVFSLIMLPTFIKNTVLTCCWQDTLNWLSFTIDKEYMVSSHKIKATHLKDSCVENMSAICVPRIEESKLLCKDQKHNLRIIITMISPKESSQHKLAVGMWNNNQSC